MGLAHGGMRQKSFNAYEETMRVPLVYSNPRLWSKPQTSQVMVSQSTSPDDGQPRRRAGRGPRNWQGVDYSDHDSRALGAAPQDYVVFTYDDYQSGQSSPRTSKPPQHIVSMRERRCKIAEYYDVNGKVPSQWEMYDLKRDPLERHESCAQGIQAHAGAGEAV